MSESCVWIFRTVCLIWTEPTKMKFQVITLFPELIEAGVSSGVLGQAVKKGLLSVERIHPRDFTDDPHRSVDDRPFGGSDGMVFRPEIAAAAIARAREAGPTHVIHLSPQGRVLSDAKVRELATKPGLTFLCGRYAGVDQRVLNSHVDEEISIGDYVLSGGELAALVVIDAVARRIPGVLGHHLSADRDSFADGRLLEGPLFTRPRDWDGALVPEVLLSGHHERIEGWQRQVGALATLARRPELLASWSRQELVALGKFWKGMSPEDLAVCGLQGISDADFEALLKDR